MRRSILLALCAFFAGAIAGTGSMQVADNTDRVPIPQPSTWVSFTAKLDVITPERQSLAGRFMRGADGSSRIELADGKGWSSIDIDNYSTNTYFRFVKTPARERWFAGKYEPPLDSKLPVFTTGVTGMSLYSRKLAVVEGQDGSLAANEGLDAWLYADSRSMRLLAPQLNFAMIVNTSVTGRRWDLSAIRVGSVPAAHFEPPAAAVVDWSGPVNKGLGAPLAH